MNITAPPLLSSLSLLLLSLAIAGPAAAAEDPPGTVTIDVIQAYDAAAQSKKLSQGFEGVGFVATYDVVCDSGKDEHEFRFEDKGFLFRVDRGGVLKIRGASELDDRLNKVWFCGDKVPANKIELRFDGDRLRVEINGQEFGPVWVRKGKPLTDVGDFAISITGSGTRIENLRVVPWHTTDYKKLQIPRITPDDAKATKLRLDRDWPEARWFMEFDYTTTDRKPRLFVEARELGYTFEIRDSRLTVTGRSDEARIELGSAWLRSRGDKNHVVARFDGDNLSFEIAGKEIGPIPVRRGLSDDDVMTWVFILSDGLIENFEMRRYEEDRDGDGIADPRDGCPDVPEDMDGFEDGDGCPDPDNDSDGILDAADRCPDEAENENNWEDQDGCPDEVSDSDGDGISDLDDKCIKEREDKDGWEDEDGCPELDNDGDGILDAADACRDVAETKNGWEDADGCPDEVPDSDGDGIIDTEDQCASIPEDRDGFEDTDGCPDPDNDGDGIVDGSDKCPDVAEVINGYEDADGCPDVPPAIPEPPAIEALAQVEEVIVADKVVRKIKIRDRVFFDTGLASIKPESYAVLDAVVDVLEENPELKRIRIEGHTDGEGSEASNLDLSQRRTASVKVYLVGRGINPDRLIPQGFGESRPLDSNETVTGRAVNRRVEFVVLD